MTKQEAVEKLANLLEAREDIGGDVATLAQSVGLSRQRLYQLANAFIEKKGGPTTIGTATTPCTKTGAEDKDTGKTRT